MAIKGKYANGRDIIAFSPAFSKDGKIFFTDISYKENGLSTLVDGDIINYFENIKSDITKIGYLSYLTELVTGVYKECENKNRVLHTCGNRACFNRNASFSDTYCFDICEYNFGICL